MKLKAKSLEMDLLPTFIFLDSQEALALSMPFTGSSAVPVTAFV